MGFSLKRITKPLRKVAKPITKGARFVAAPMMIATETVAKGATWAAAKTGAKPLKKLDRAMGKELRRTVTAYKPQVAIGAAVGGAIIGKPQIGAAVAKVADAIAPTSSPKDAPATVAQTGDAAPGGAKPSSSSPSSSSSAPLTFGAWLLSLLAGARGAK